ncbi:M48 family metalloprotease [Aliiroseovarius sp. F47248L]|uniref:M48 family metalloprotease n=1 Tax=Aliiroseovarius sp. F47248L TaxID=2926420 RepID=UPI001FF29034|nr:M48 family metalloprotease [Aliiroseovarius sp. F47248L]MCK0140019.1 M48 family metalloprotease [Aliiroseovarius sp. F47248L]
MPQRRTAQLIAIIATSVVLISCGTTYEMPKVNETVTSRANSLFAQAKSAPPRKLASPSTGTARFHRVARRVQPVARKLCETELAQGKNIDCNVRIEIDTEMEVRNAYFTYLEKNNQKPVIRFSVPILRDAASDDEVAFVMGHEYGHLIGQHIQKGEQQAMAGALILGAIAAYGNAQAASVGAYYDPNSVDNSVRLGAALGQRAFSQTYELESDMIGTRIAAAAGYDPVKGAQFFARDEAARSSAGQLSFWGTHPADEKRMEVVIATMEQIKAQRALARK